VGWWGKIVIPMPEALSFAESRRQKDIAMYEWTSELEQMNWALVKVEQLW
jgi:hypothetical protein